MGQVQLAHRRGLRQADAVRALSRPWLAVAALVLSLTLQQSDGFYHEPTLPWLALSLIAAILGVSGVQWPWAGAPRDATLVTRALLAAGVIVSALSLVNKPVARYMAEPRPWAHPELLLAVAVAAVTALSVQVAHGRAARLRAGAVIVAVGLWLGAWTIRESPHPHIDVLPVHIDAFAAVGRGESPYGITFTDMYKANEAFYSPEMRDGRRILFGFPYPPLSLLMAWPGHALLGDLRYSEVLALVVTAGVIIWIGSRRRGQEAVDEAVAADGAIALTAAAALVLAPRVIFHLEQGWTEPFPIVLLTATVATAVARPRLAWLPLGLLIASKQHMALGLLFAPMLVERMGESGVDGSASGTHQGSGAAIGAAGSPNRLITFQTVRFVGKALAVTAVVTLPLALLDVDAFMRSAVLLQVREPFRLDSLSFTRALVAHGWPLDKEGALAVSLTAGVFGIAISWWRAPRTPAGFAASLGLTCFLLTAFGKKAFLNYYFLVVAALLVAVVADRRSPQRSDTGSESASNASGEMRPQ